MHPSSRATMTRLLGELAAKHSEPWRVLDVGSFNVNGTYRDLIKAPWTYEGSDVQAGPNVDRVQLSPYVIRQEPSLYDLVISGQTLEHVQEPIKLVAEMARMMKPGAICILTAPYQSIIHRFPIDCWRVNPDGMDFMLRNAGLQLLRPSWTEGEFDCWGMAQKPGLPKRTYLLFMCGDVVFTAPDAPEQYLKAAIENDADLVSPRWDGRGQFSAIKGYDSKMFLCRPEAWAGKLPDDLPHEMWVELALGKVVADHHLKAVNFPHPPYEHLHDPDKIIAFGAGRKNLLLHNFRSPGDIAVLTGAVRDLKLAVKDKYAVDVDCSFGDLWENNPYLAKFARASNWRDLIEQSKKAGGPLTVGDTIYLAVDSGSRDGHLLSRGKKDYYQSFLNCIEVGLNERIPAGDPRPDFHLSAAEMREPPRYSEPYIILNASCRQDGSAKLWPPEYSQAVADALAPNYRVVQTGASGTDYHPTLKGVTDLVGKTSLRELMMLIRQAKAVVTPISFPLHVAAAFRVPCICVAGANEPNDWAHYRGVLYVGATDGVMPCSCWSYGDCKNTVEFNSPMPHTMAPGGKLAIARCKAMITPRMVLDALSLCGITVESGGADHGAPDGCRK